MAYRNMFDIKEKQKMQVDLHIHTSASDGTWSTGELVRNVIDRNITVFSVTDHDSMEYIGEVKRLAEAQKLLFIPGIEVSTTFENRNYHILGYGIENMKDKLKEICSRNKKTFEKIDIDSIRFLEDTFESISLYDFELYTHDTMIGGWKAYSYCVKKGLCSSMREYFDLFKGTNLENPFKSNDLATPNETIEAIKESGGIPILAHPGVTFYDQNIDFVVQYFYRQGIEGLECYHTENSEKVKAYCLEFCREHDLVVTGGSDCHGDLAKTRIVGVPDIRLTQINLLDRLKKENS